MLDLAEGGKSGGLSAGDYYVKIIDWYVFFYSKVSYYIILY